MKTNLHLICPDEIIRSVQTTESGTASVRYKGKRVTGEIVGNRFIPSVGYKNANLFRISAGKFVPSDFRS